MSAPSSVSGQKEARIEQQSAQATQNQQPSELRRIITERLQRHFPENRGGRRQFTFAPMAPGERLVYQAQIDAWRERKERTEPK